MGRWIIAITLKNRKAANKTIDTDISGVNEDWGFYCVYILSQHFREPGDKLRIILCQCKLPQLLINKVIKGKTLCL